MQFAIVAGGSKGIGYAVAAALAKRRYNLVLVGRDPIALVEGKNSLESLYKIEVKTIELDLGLPEAADIIAAWCHEKKIALNVLCNAAGLGGKRDYLSLPPDVLRNMISINLTSQMALCLSLLPFLEKNTPSYILNVSSMAGFSPIPEKNLYSATKAAVIYFSYSLRYQLKKKNISVSCLCPGPVFTKPEIKQDTIDKLGWFGKVMAVSPDKVGELAVQNTLRKKMIIIPGVLPKIVTVLLRMLPIGLTTYLYFRTRQNKFVP